MKKILILEDNQAVLEQLSKIVYEVDPRNVVCPFVSVKDAYHCALEQTIDLFIIDIILDTSKPGDASGLRYIENIREVKRYSFTPVIFVTSLEDAQLYTYEKLHCYSFIEKPFDVKRLKEIIKECLGFPGNVSGSKTLFFRKEGIVLAVEREDIVYAESVNHAMHIHTKHRDELIIPYITLKKLLDEMDSAEFIQCSRSVIVNTKFICNVDMPNRFIELKDGFGRLEIGVAFKKTVKDKIY